MMGQDAQDVGQGNGHGDGDDGRDADDGEEGCQSGAPDGGVAPVLRKAQVYGRRGSGLREEVAMPETVPFNCLFDCVWLCLLS